MISHYRDISLLPGSDINLNFLRNRVFSALHIALVESMQESHAVALSFPDYAPEVFSLGARIRLMGTESALSHQRWLNVLDRFSDYNHLTSVRPVRTNVTQHGRFVRRQLKTNLARIARRKARREGISLAEAERCLSKAKPQRTKLPFIELRSASSGERFRIFIERQLEDVPTDGAFNSYGLSKGASVPLF